MSLPAADFQEGQIVYLQHESLRLYAETIQIIKPRKICWARPLALVELSDLEGSFSTPFILQDLRQGSDLLLPIALFHVALDVDAIPIITQLDAPKGNPTLPTLQHFIRQIWQAYPEQFSSSAP